MKLSIIVSVYNTAKYLEQCLASVLNQTMNVDDYEVIIVNDCSTDNSMDIINEQVKNHRNVRVIDKKENEMTFWSRVDGVCAAKGDYIGFIDSDDWIEPDMYKTMVKKGMESGADMVECGTIYEFEDGHEHPLDKRDDRLLSAVDVVKTYSERPSQLALYVRIFSRTAINRFLTQMYPYFNDRRQEYRIRVEDDLLYPLFLSCCDTVMYVKEHFCHHRMERTDSNMDQINKNPVKTMETGIYRVKAGFVVMEFTKDNPDMLKYISQKQIETMFSLLGRFLQSDLYSKKEAASIMNGYIREYAKTKKRLSAKYMLRFIHLKLKALYCFGLM